MNRYRLAAAIEKVDGYFLPRPDEVALKKTQFAFIRAKAECLEALINQMTDIEALTWEKFNDLKNRKTGD